MPEPPPLALLAAAGGPRYKRRRKPHVRSNQEGPTMPRIIIEKNIDIPMRDGCVLKGDLFRPDTPEKLPVLLNRTPYDKKFPQISFNTSTRYARPQRGYNVVFVDCRGSLRLARHLHLLRRRDPRRLRHHRTGRAPAVGRRQGRHVRGVLYGRDAMARGDPVAAKPQGDGALRSPPAITTTIGPIRAGRFRFSST